MLKRGIGLAVMLSLVLGWFSAATAVRGTGFAVSPAFGEVNVPAGRAEVPYTVQIINRNPVDQIFALSVVDFGALDEQGGVAFLGAPASELEHKYGLAPWLELEQKTVTVLAGKTVQVKGRIVNRPSLAPGGHYGAVLATAVNEAGRPVGSSVGVKQVVSSLVLVAKEGGAEPALRMVSQTADAAFWHLPGKVEQRYRNDGNVHVVPRGVVEVRDAAGRVVRRGAINEGSGAILPESFRRYKTELIRVAPAWMPGQYRIVSTYRYDGTDKAHQYITTFWYEGALVIWLVVALAAVTVGVLAWWLWWRPQHISSK